MRTKPLIACLMLALVCGSWAWAASPGALGEGMVNPGYEEKPEWFKLSFLDLKEDVREASEADKRVLLYFYQDGCPYCAKLLQDNFGQRELAEKTRKHFDVIALNMWGDREVTDLRGRPTTEKQFAAQMRVHFTPTMLFLDEQGQQVLRVNGYYFPAKFETALDYVADKREAEMEFREYFAKRNPSPANDRLHSDKRFLQPPYDLRAAARPGDKPLMVLFEQKQCRGCDELHEDILQRKDSGAEMRNMDVVLLDQWAQTPLVAPDGKKTTAREWARQLDIAHAPTMVFFEDGTEVFRTEAYLKAFHVQGAMAYVHSGAYKEQPSFQRFLQARTEALREQGVHVKLMD